MIEKSLRNLSRFFELLCAFFFVVMGASLTLQIFSRYFMAQSIFWAEELSRYAMIWLVYLGVVVAARERAHTRIDFFVGLLPGMGNKTIKVLVNIVCLLFLAGIAYYSWDLMRLGMMLKSSALRIPMYFVYASVPFCCFFTAIYLLWEIPHIIRDDFDALDPKEAES